jgi:hypothetical protein
LQARHDHGSQYVSDHFQDDLTFLGLTSSPAFVQWPEGKGVAGRFIRTLKEQLLWVRPFETVEELRVAVLEFKDRCNREWLCERHGHQSPAAVRAAGGMSGPRLKSEPHNGPRIVDLGGGRYLTIPRGGRSDAVTINSVSRKSGAVQSRSVERLSSIGLAP